MKSINSYLNKIIQGDTLKVLKTFPNECIDVIITSPPYWGLRDYGEETKTIWDGDKNCEHQWVETGKKQSDAAIKRGPNSILGPIIDKDREPQNLISSFCQKCGSWYGQLGLEPTLDLYIKHLLQITLELKRVLKPTGVMFWNHGDCYGGSGMGTWKNPPEKIESKEVYHIPYGSNVPARKNRDFAKCLMLQNYRLILRMIDEQGWILRNDIKWHKKNHMPSSVKDRFTNSYEPVFMLVKNNKTQYYYNTKTGLMTDRKPTKLKKGFDWDFEKVGIVDKNTFNVRVRDAKKERFLQGATKEEIENYKKGKLKKISYWKSLSYWFDLDAVRVPHTVCGVTDKRPMGILRQKLYPGSAYNKSNDPHLKQYQGQIKTHAPSGHKIENGKIEEVKLNYILQNSTIAPHSRRQTKIPKEQAESFGSPRARYHRYTSDYIAPVGPKMGKDKDRQEWSSRTPNWSNIKGKNPGDVWDIPTQPFPKAHFATFPEKLVEPIIKSSCPQWICKKCGKARVRITKTKQVIIKEFKDKGKAKEVLEASDSRNVLPRTRTGLETRANHQTIGWTDCGCKAGWT